MLEVKNLPAFEVKYVPFIYFVFIAITLGNEILLWFMSECSMFSSKISIVAGLTLRFLNHFEFIFMCGVRKCSNLILLHIAVQFPQNHLLKRLSFFHCIFLLPLSKTRWCEDKQGEKTTLGMGESNSKWNNWQRINLQNIQAAEYQKNKQPNQKVGRRSKQTFLQRRYTDG